MQKSSTDNDRDRRDNEVDAALWNWVAVQKSHLREVNAPEPNAKPASWQKDYRADNQDDPDKPAPPDETWAEKVNAAMTRLALVSTQHTNLIQHHYWYENRQPEKLMKKVRWRLWLFL